MVAWSEVLEWNWPNGGPAKWNPRFWDHGTPRREIAEALMDAITRQERYTIGCYTAVKMVIFHAVVDDYGRMKTSREQFAEVKSRLWADEDPLVNIEPARTWKFEVEFDRARQNDLGKLLRIEEGVAAGNFVPGDWAYILNTDHARSLKTGYEGSNAIYMGQNRFSDYYNDNDHSYAFREKLEAVYQWRHGVFSRSRHAAKLVPLSLQDYEHLGKTPEEGGLVLNIRLVPHLFGYEDLPAWVSPPFPKPPRGQDIVLEQTP
ncbi:hypothetical protein QTI66_39360 [Variovorax sp. J22R133]|uniref:hypothetical protein n=1 Tax=Variovorax brevis TaxID=3053503 RepID=UPI002576A076|nr:hypothetical protein [Variovorax sp. J22R133]MDM0118128.1 hypothetical protein [Variovorax sp. J22R133]